MAIVHHAAAPSPRLPYEKRKVLVLATAITAGSACLQYYSRYYDKSRKFNSILTGQVWVDELIAGHRRRFYEAMGMNKHVFRRLLAELRVKTGFGSTRYVSASERLAIFLYLAVTGLSQRHLEEGFQQSPNTISKAIHGVLDALTAPALYNTYVKLPDAAMPLAAEIRNNSTFYPYFKDCIESIDGTHIDSFILKDSV